MENQSQRVYRNIRGNTRVLLSDKSQSILQMMGLQCQMLTQTVSQCEKKMDIGKFFTSKGVEAEAQISSHAEPRKQGV